jgi:ADP-ribose pyrophosphatase
MADDLTDAAVPVELGEPEHRGGGFYRYERYRVKLDGAAFERDAVRIGRVVVILAADLDRDELVLIRQFRLGAHLALGLGDVVEVPAGRVERGENVADAARRECREEIGIEPARLVPLFDLMPSAGSSDEHMFFFLGVVDAARCPSAPARRTSRRTRGRFACRSAARWRRSRPASCTTARRCCACNGWRSTARGCARSPGTAIPRDERHPRRVQWRAGGRVG